MHYIIFLSLGLISIFLSFTSLVNASMVNIDDLLTPELPQGNSQLKSTENQAQLENDKKKIEDILGEKDIFPFLPDNHRDSGTGKFNSF